MNNFYHFFEKSVFSLERDLRCSRHKIENNGKKAKKTKKSIYKKTIEISKNKHFQISYFKLFYHDINFLALCYI